MNKEFQQFMIGLRADARLGRLFPGDLAKQSAEVIILTLASQLADAHEGKPRLHPAFALLEELDAAEAGR